MALQKKQQLMHQDMGAYNRHHAGIFQLSEDGRQMEILRLDSTYLEHVLAHGSSHNVGYTRSRRSEYD